MAKKRNPIARDPILRKGGAHFNSKSGQRRNRKHTLMDEIEAYFDERRDSPCNRGGNPSVYERVLLQIPKPAGLAAYA